MNEASRPPIRWGSVIGVIAAILVIIGVGTLLFSVKRTEADKFAVSYGGGPTESRHFQGVFPPGDIRINGFLDKWYKYPAGIRNYIVSEDASENDQNEADAIQATSSDQQTIDWQLSVNFKLNTNLLRKFHEQVGLKFKAFEGDGWDRMLQQTLRQQLISSLQSITRRYDVESLWSDGKVLSEVRSELGSTLKDAVNSTLGDQYFCGPDFEYTGDGVGNYECPDFAVVVKKPGIQEKIRKAFEDNRTSDILVQTRQNEVKQRAEEARAIQEIRKELSPEYVMLRAIEEGKIKFWVLPQSSGLTLQTPSR